MVRSELPPDQRGGPTPDKKRRKEVPQFTLIERICHGVEVVQMGTGERKYHVVWEKDDTPTHTFFSHLQAVLNQHERVIESNLGTQIPLAAKKLLHIPGETQRMAELSYRLSTLGARYLVPLKAQSTLTLKREIDEVSGDLGQVRNKYSKDAKLHLKSALLAPEESHQVDEVLKANLAILDRNKKCLGIVQGTLGRFRTVSQKREEWEAEIEKNFYHLAQRLEELQSGPSERQKKQMINEILGKRAGILARLNGISDPDYYQRIHSRSVQNLARFGEFLGEGNEKRAKRILRQAILKLKRVISDRQERKKTNRER